MVDVATEIAERRAPWSTLPPRLLSEGPAVDGSTEIAVILSEAKGPMVDVATDD